MNPSARTLTSWCMIGMLTVTCCMNQAAAEDPARKGPPPAAVRVAKATAKNVRLDRTFLGTVTPTRTSMIGAGVGGSLLKLNVREGQRVEAGDVVATLRKDLIAPQLAAARAKLLRIEEEVKELEEGTRAEEIEEARTLVAAADVAIATAERKLVTAKRLNEKNTISREEVRDAEDTLRMAKATRTTRVARLAVLNAGTRPVRIAQAKAGHAMQQAEIARLEALEARYTIKAPFVGYVVAEHTEEGAWVREGDSLVTIQALDTVRVRIPVLEDYATALAPGAEVTVRLSALPARIFKGTIERIIPRAHSTARAIPVDVALTNERQTDGGVLIKPGMSARATLAVGNPVDAVLVPLDALTLGGPSPMVYVVTGENQAVPTPVTIGAADGSHIVVRGAIKQGQRVVVEGNERIFPGQPIQILER